MPPRRYGSPMGPIIPAVPDRLWGWMPRWPTPGTTVAKRNDRFAALERIYNAVGQRFGAVPPDVARGIAMRHDWGPQYTSGHFQGALRWLGLEASPAFAGGPPCNGCAERFIRTLKDQCLWARTYGTVHFLVERWPPAGPRHRGLERGRRAEHRRVLLPTSHDLQADR